MSATGIVSGGVGPIAVFFAVVAGGVGIVSENVQLEALPTEPSADDFTPSAEADFVLEERDFPCPVEFLFSRPNARGWKQSGTMAIDEKAGELVVSNLMTIRGFAAPRSVASDAGEQILTEWRREDGLKVMWLLRRVASNRTFFSWGVSK